MATVVALCVMVLAALSIVCFAAYKIKGSISLSTAIGHLASLDIKITSPEHVEPRRQSAADTETDMTDEEP